jgi:6-phosphogluconolactonase
MKQATSAYVYVGTYASQQDPGIFAYTLDNDKGTLSYINSTAGIEHPGFLTISSDHQRLYTVSETGEIMGMVGGSVAAFAIQPQSKALTFLNQRPTTGEDPCHIVLDGSQHYIVVSNYSGGSICLYPLQADGEIGELADKIQHHGSSNVHPERQEKAHTHSATFDPSGEYAFVADLGQDKIVTYKLDTTTQKLVRVAETVTKPGSGPRHFTFHPTGNYAYSINELDSTVTAYAFDPQSKELKSLQTISTLPADFHGENTTADIHIHPAGTFLYGSNRGHDSIAVFALDPATGKLTSIEQVATGGKCPRNFALTATGSFLLAANQLSNNIVTFAIDQQTGSLTATGDSIEIPSPVCIKIIDEQISDTLLITD